MMSVTNIPHVPYSKPFSDFPLSQNGGIKCAICRAKEEPTRPAYHRKKCISRYTKVTDFNVDFFIGQYNLLDKSIRGPVCRNLINRDYFAWEKLQKKCKPPIEDCNLPQSIPIASQTSSETKIRKKHQAGRKRILYSNCQSSEAK